MANKIGDRVFAVQSADDEQVILIGFGKYVGDEVPEGWAIKNPKIILDDGRVVWGAECWWGPEARYVAWKGTRKEVAPEPATAEAPT